MTMSSIFKVNSKMMSYSIALLVRFVNNYLVQTWVISINMYE